MGDLMRGTLGSWETKLKDRPLILRVYDGDSTAAEDLLYDSRGPDKDRAISAKATLTRQFPLDFAGRRWTLVFTQLGELVSGPAFRSIMVFFITGTSISILLFFLALSWLGTRAKALRIADRLTGEMREMLWRMESVIEGTRMGTWEWNVQTGETVFNEQWANLVGYTLDELAPVSVATWERLAFPEDLKRSEELLERHYAGELTYYDCECRMIHKDGRFVWVRDRGRVVTRDDDGKPLMMFGTISDITASKEVENALLKTSEENKDLLGELQHRVKNSFAMISSMMAIASGSNVSPETKLALEELDSRVRSVSELYSLLYSSGSFTELRLDDYCVRVAAPLVGLNGNIAMSSDMESMMVSAKRAAPIGLILTELITNAVKYAFPGNRRGTVFVSLKKAGAGAVLEVRDDGVGLPEGFVAGRSGMGLMLVEALVGQIHGAFRMEGSAAGTRCVLEIPLP
jgi:PAS domain S-box-containing protein